MSSPNRDKYRARGGKMLDENDSVFDLTGWIKSVGVSILTAFKIKDSSGAEIDPATKQKQDEIKTALDSVGIANKEDTRVDPATEDKQNDIIEAVESNSEISIVDPETGIVAKVASLGELKTIIPTRLAGTAFSNGTKDTNFWNETVVGTGSVVQAGEITICTGTTSGSSAKYQTIRKARKITGSANQFRAVARNKEETTADCLRRIGAYDDDNGFFMQFDGSVFGVVIRKGGVDTVVTNGNFNGNAGATIDISGTAFIKVVIEYTSLAVKYFVNGTLIHTVKATEESLVESQDLKATIEIINEGANIKNNCFEILFATILRLGQLESENQFKHISGITTTVCKYGAGRLERLINNDSTSGKTIKIYDGLSALGNQIAEIDAGVVIGNIEFGVPFNDGLTIVTNSASADLTAIYE